MEKELYYAVLYTPKVNMNEIKIDYDVLGAISGEYDSEKRVFISEHTGIEYEMLDTGILHLDDLEKRDYSDLPEETAKIHKQGIFFAFPIKAKDFEERYNSFVSEIDQANATNTETPVEEGKPVEKIGPLSVQMGYGLYDPEVYAACVSYFNLFSVYNSFDSYNYFYVFDGDNKTLLQVDDLGKDIDRALDEATVIGTDQKMPTPIVTLQLPALNELVGRLFGGADSAPKEEPKKEEQQEEDYEDEPIEPFDPDELEKAVKSEVIGQDAAINTLVTTIYNNMKYGKIYPKLKSNILIAGSAGCGKTEMVESVARHLKIPFARFDMSTVSETGFVGNSMSQAIRNLIYAAGGDVEKAKYGILFLDEIDKIAATGGEGITTSGVQDECLSILGGEEITVPAENFRESSFVFSTAGVTVVSAGAFSDLFDSRAKEGKQMGFASQPPQDVNRPIETIDFKKSGIKPELIRRHKTVITIRQLDNNDMYDIITKSKISNLLIREEAFELVDNVKVMRLDGYVEAVAEQSVKEAIGASGIQRVVDNSLKVATRKLRLLNGEGGTLVLKKETVANPADFELFKIDGEKVYPTQPTSIIELSDMGKTKTLGTGV